MKGFALPRQIQPDTCEMMHMDFKYMYVHQIINLFMLYVIVKTVFVCVLENDVEYKYIYLF